MQNRKSTSLPSRDALLDTDSQQNSQDAQPVGRGTEQSKKHAGSDEPSANSWQENASSQPEVKAGQQSAGDTLLDFLEALWAGIDSIHGIVEANAAALQRFESGMTHSSPLTTLEPTSEYSRTLSMQSMSGAGSTSESDA